MSQKISFQIDQFLIIFGLVLICLIFFALYTSRSILQSVIISRQINEELLEENLIHLNKEDLEKAYTAITKTNTTSLDLTN
jgi:hypothetical protein